jgi:hypothetical protein
MPIRQVSTPGGAYFGDALRTRTAPMMLSPLSTTGHLIGKPNRRPRLELGLVLLNVGAYAFTFSAVVSSL